MFNRENVKNLVQYNVRLAPKKKFRGKRRYFGRIDQKAKDFRLENTADNWWNLWHYHADWLGYGNCCWRYRKRHLSALMKVYSTCAQQMMATGRDFQLWIQIAAGDAGQDAVFLHTENPHSDFPFFFENVYWEQADVAQYFEGLLGLGDIEAGKMVWEEDSSFVVYLKGIGKTLKT